MVAFSPQQLPAHIAFIMDGNGRWARTRGLLRMRGYEEGAGALRRITTRCRELGVSETTFFALSTENYLRRPSVEIRFLMKLLKTYLIRERPVLMENGIRLTTIGDVSSLPADVQETLEETRSLTAGNDQMVMRLALNYGSRQEILTAVRRICQEVKEGRIDPERLNELTEDSFAAYLGDPQMKDPDLVIRTAGEYRLSNFLLWQSSYSELWITNELWPDFDVEHLEQAVEAFVSRDRKYGAVLDGVSRESSPGSGGI
ncbi:MAG: polyprenyl diphosphate synthase [Planctomycetota bacterium]|nr:polyprenyl diphosphate synthase [Planctomycetota bacterium]